MATLAQLKVKVLQLVGDTAGSQYASALLDQALSLALADYSQVLPQYFTHAFTVTAAGRDQTITGITFADTDRILKVYFPYTVGEIDHNVYEAYYVANSLGNILITFSGNSVPAVGQKMLLFCAKQHTIKDLAAATVTSFPTMHEHIIVTGGAAYATVMRVGMMDEAYTDKSTLVGFTNMMMSQFMRYMDTLRTQAAHSDILPQSTSWRLDEFDTQDSPA